LIIFQRLAIILPESGNPLTERLTLEADKQAPFFEKEDGVFVLERMTGPFD